MDEQMPAGVVLTDFELGQLFVLVGPTNLSKLSPELRQKLKRAFAERTEAKSYEYATEEPPETHE